MRVLIVSDSHRQCANIEKILKKEGKFDLMVHCGDVEGSEDYLEQIIGCPMHVVAGNNDYFSALPHEEIFNIGRYKVFLTHGHYLYVSMGVERLVDEARSRGVDIIMYGHTHKPHIEMIGGIMVINPGSISYPRQEGKIPTYIIMDIDKQGDVQFTLNYLN